jgi:hypothetical protein
MLPPPPGMKQAAWEYLVRFTTEHEWPVLHMYNNKRSEGDRQDVTCGIGILLTSRDSACQPEIKAMFRNKNTGQPATDDELRADWDTASNILRTGNNLEHTADNKGYGDQCQLVMDATLVGEYSQKVLQRKLADVRKPGACQELNGFAQMPAQAQVAIASFNYGYLVTVTKNFRAALGDWDFDRAARESFLKGLAPQKLLGHRTLFWNAARIVEQSLDFDQLPAGVNPVGPLIPWAPWEETVVTPDPARSGVVRHETAPRKPDTVK